MAAPVTLDQLVEMVARGFEDVHRKLDSHTAILEQHSAFHVDHSHRFDRIERKLDNVIDRLNDHDVRIQALEGHRDSKP